MCDNRSSTKYKFFKVIFVAECALPIRRPCTISLSLDVASAAVSFGQICLKLLSSTSSTALAKPCLLRMSPSVLWWHNLHHLHGYIHCFTVSSLHHIAVRSWESLAVTCTLLLRTLPCGLHGFLFSTLVSFLYPHFMWRLTFSCLVVVCVIQGSVIH